VTRLILWRHGQTAWNAEDRVQGQTDVELSVRGFAEAAAVAPRLAALRPDLLAASDLRRAADTAAQLAAVTGLPVTLDMRLRERNFGDWQGHTLADIQERSPAAFDRWRAGLPVGEAGVEDLDDLAKRVAAALQELVARAPGGTVVVATHGGAARHGTATLLGWPEPVANTLAGLANCHWTELRFDPVRGWRLTAHNVC
jgi:probable phosphoglycerate mutase